MNPLTAAPYSLRRRLVLLLIAAVGAIWLVSAMAAYRLAHDQADVLFDAQLTQVAETMLAIVAGGEVEEFVDELEEHAGHSEVPIAFEIWSIRRGRTRLLTGSPGARSPFPQVIDGFSERDYAGASWRFHAVQDREGEYRVVVGQAHAAREHLARRIGLNLLLPAALALPLMAFAVWWGVGRAMRPLEAVARQVGALDPQRLTPVEQGEPLPREVAPLRDALNALIERVARAFDNERRFTADAAHELRTPLAALRVQAQVAQRSAVTADRQHALDQVIAGVDRMTHLVDQLLTLARVDPGNAHVVAGPVDPAPVAARVCAELAPAAARRGQQLEVDDRGACLVSIQPAWLEVALRNLVDNALRYAGDGAQVRVSIRPEGGACVIAVEDDGPGIAPGLRPALLQRFARGEDVDAQGCGLGLSIVARIATLSAARFELDDGLPRADGGHGLAVRLRFGA